MTVADLDIAKDKDIEIMTHMNTPVVSVMALKGNVPEEETTEEKGIRCRRLTTLLRVAGRFHITEVREDLKWQMK